MSPQSSAHIHFPLPARVLQATPGAATAAGFARSSRPYSATTANEGRMNFELRTTTTTTQKSSIQRRWSSRTSKSMAVKRFLVVFFFFANVLVRVVNEHGMTTDLPQTNKFGLGFGIQVVEAKRRSTSQQQEEDKRDEKEEDSELLDKMLRESEVLLMIEREQKQHDRRLNELHQRLEKELVSVQSHFEKVMGKLRETEQQLETNLKNVERAISNKMEESKKTVKAHNDSWRFPFFILVVLIIGVAGFFGNLYRRATKHTRML